MCGWVYFRLVFVVKSFVGFGDGEIDVFGFIGCDFGEFVVIGWIGCGEGCICCGWLIVFIYKVCVW